MFIIGIGETIKKLRAEKGLSARELARRSEISQAYLSQLETGDSKNPTTNILEKIAKGLNVEYFYLLKQTENFKGVFAEEVNKRADEQIKRINKDGAVINPEDPEKFHDPINIKRQIVVPKEYKINGGIRELKNSDILDLYYLISMGIDKKDTINLMYKGEPIKIDDLKMVMSIIDTILK